MDRDELACRIGEALAARDRARKSMLFRPGRIHTADEAFVAAVCGLAGELAAAMVAEVVERDRETRLGAQVRGATAGTYGPRSPAKGLTPPGPQPDPPARPKPAARRTTRRKDVGGDS